MGEDRPATRGPIRVGQCVDGLRRGGAELIVRLLVRYSSPQFEHRVYAFAEGPMREELEELGAQVTVVPRRWKKFDPSLVARLARRFRTEGVDLVHTHIFGACLHGRLAARMAGGIPVVVTEHNVAAKYGPAQRWANRQLAPWARKIVAVSEEVGKSLTGEIGVEPGRVRVVQNGIDLERLSRLPGREEARRRLGIGEREAVIGSVGRLTRQKAYRYLLEALAELARERREMRLVLVGEGEERAKLEERAQALGVRERVSFLGVVADVREVLPAFDVFALSSLWEGLPMALLEAMAVGLPCVVTPAGGIAEVIEDGVNGRLAPLRDGAALAEAIGEALDQPEAAKQWGERGRETVRQRFTAERMVGAYEEIYQEALGLC